MADVVYSNVRELLRQIQSIEPDLRKELVKDLKAIAKPVQAEIVSAIPARAPLRGMNNNGRMSWDNAVNYKGRKTPAKSVTVKFRSGNSRFTAITSLVSVQVNSPVVSMIDMARNSNTPQGQHMVATLGRKPSRYAWPAAERALPKAEAEAKKILDAAAVRISRKFN